MSLPSEKPPTEPTEGPITQLLARWNGDDAIGALEQLMPQVVDELRRLARRYLANERPGHTLQPTALVNEVYLRLVEGNGGGLDDRRQFFAFAARLMRQILVDHARTRRALKRGGGETPVDLSATPTLASPEPLDTETLLALDQALESLGRRDPRQRSIVELRNFAGLTMPEIAEVLGLSLPTVERGWAMARRWLAREMAGN